VRSKRIVAKIAGSEVAAYNLADIDDSGQLTLYGNDPIADIILSPDSLQIDIEFRGSLGSGRPLAMKSPAFASCAQEFFAPTAGRLFEEMGDVPPAIIFQVCFSESHSGHQTVSADRHPVEHRPIRR
jgi:hypothetical protein